MRAEHFKRWLMTARNSEKDKETAEKEEATTTTDRAWMIENCDVSATQKEPKLDNYTRVVDLVQSAFREGKLAEEATW